MLFRELLSYLDKKDIFNGIVSAVVFLALSLIFQLLRSQAPKVRKYLRKFRARYLLKLRKKRFDQRYFAYQVSKENCLFILFIIVAIVNFLLVFRATRSEWYGIFILMLPTFIFEIKWLIQQSHVEDLIRYQPKNRQA